MENEQVLKKWIPYLCRVRPETNFYKSYLTSTILNLFAGFEAVNFIILLSPYITFSTLMFFADFLISFCCTSFFFYY